jgi:inosine-uridine nucleoside N-ribohydrolase
MNIQGYVAKDNYFGKDGLNNKQAKYEAMLGPDDWALVQEETAYDFISKSANKYKKNLGMIFTAPLTNLAIAYLINNEIPNLIGGLTIMGGSYSGVGMNHAFSA